jgi:hypothetical protein
MHMRCRTLTFSFICLLEFSGFSVAKAQDQPTARGLTQERQIDPQSYCTYLTELALAQSDLLKTPKALSAFTQPETGLPTQLVVGASLSLSDYKKAGVTLDVARRNCDLYKASIGVQQYLQYALANVERDALRNRLGLIDHAKQSLDELVAGTSKMVDAQNMTRPMLWALKTNGIKLESDRADTESKIASIYVPALSEEPLKSQVSNKQASEVNEQRSQDRLSRQNNWDIALSVGAHQQIYPVSDGVQPYGQVTVTYNLASRAIDRHLDRAGDAYANWKKVQEGDVVRNMEVLRTQVVATIASQEKRLKSLQDEAAQVEKDLQTVGDADTSAGLDFRNQLTSTKLLLGIETGDATYRLNRLQTFLDRNF